MKAINFTNIATQNVLSVKEYEYLIEKGKIIEIGKETVKFLLEQAKEVLEKGHSEGRLVGDDLQRYGELSIASQLISKVLVTDSFKGVEKFIVFVDEIEKAEEDFFNKEGFRIYLGDVSFQKNMEEKEIIKSLEENVFYKGIPIGTVKQWKGGSFVKVDEGKWIPYKGDRPSPDPTEKIKLAREKKMLETENKEEEVKVEEIGERSSSVDKKSFIRFLEDTPWDMESPRESKEMADKYSKFILYWIHQNKDKDGKMWRRSYPPIPVIEKFHKDLGKRINKNSLLSTQTKQLWNDLVSGESTLIKEATTKDDPNILTPKIKEFVGSLLKDFDMKPKTYKRRGYSRR